MTLSLRTPADPASLTGMRARLTRWLADVGVPHDVAFGVIAACSEAVSNAIEHTVDPREPFVDIDGERHGDVLTLQVRDYGQWRTPRLGTDRNHGLLLIDSLVDEVDIDRSDEGTTVTMRLDLAGAAAARRSA
jgi:serine/threonine-protein kinase RsbW